MKNIGIFCGSKSGNDPIYTLHAHSLGKILVQREFSVIYGGGNIGIMGTIADSVLETGGEITGVIPVYLDGKEIIHQGLTELIQTTTRSECKTMIYERSDAIVVLPGGFGTVDEFTEFLTLAKLGQHSKPIALLNTKGFFDHFMSFIDIMVEEGFMRPIYKEMILVAQSPEILMEKLNEKLNK